MRPVRLISDATTCKRIESYRRRLESENPRRRNGQKIKRFTWRARIGARLHAGLFAFERAGNQKIDAFFLRDGHDGLGGFSFVPDDAGLARHFKGAIRDSLPIIKAIGWLPRRT